MIELRPISRDGANAAIAAWHRHHKPVRGHRGACAAYLAGELVGVVVWARPVAPALDDGVTSEVVRLACRGGDAHVASRLLGAAWRSDRALGVTRMVSYTRVDEPGTCYRAAGWVPTALVTDTRGWDHGTQADRWLPGLYVRTTEEIERVRWEVGPAATATRIPFRSWMRGAA